MKKRNRKTTEISCEVCKKTRIIRVDCIPRQSTKCKSCASRAIIRSRKKTICVTCGVDVYKTSKFCFPCSVLERSGEKHYKWKADRSLLAKKQERNDPAYVYWRKQVWLRDNFTCKTANPDCSGKIEAHHILSWSEYPELRYQVNNGITLCHAHHPRKRAEEKRLSPYFQELVSVSSR